MKTMNTETSALRALMEKTVADSTSWQLEALAVGSLRKVMFLNAHGMNMAAENAAFRTALLNSDHLLRDGIGVLLGLKMLGLEETENLNGTDLIPLILQRHKAARIAVWGSSIEALADLKARLENEGYDNLISFEHGFHDDRFYLDAYARLQPDILVLCMGMPRQEVLTDKLAAAGAKGILISGGGWANFYSGHAKRAPLWVQKLRMEWFHRLSQEPLRLGKRYTIDIARYFWLVRKLRT